MGHFVAVAVVVRVVVVDNLVVVVLVVVVRLAVETSMFIQKYATCAVLHLFGLFGYGAYTGAMDGYAFAIVTRRTSPQADTRL